MPQVADAEFAFMPPPERSPPLRWGRAYLRKRLRVSASATQKDREA
jgi:hypothetical protein